MGFTSTSVMLCMGTAFSSSGGKLTEHPVTFTLSVSDWRALEEARDSIQKMRHHLESHHNVDKEVFDMLSAVSNNVTTMALYLGHDTSVTSKIPNLLKQKKAEIYAAVGLECISYMVKDVKDIACDNYMQDIDSATCGFIELSKSHRLSQ